MMSATATGTMQAFVREEYGAPDVLDLREVPCPVPEAGEVLVRVRAASVNASDWRMLRADPFLIRTVGGLVRPKHAVLGSDIAGLVEAVGPGVSSVEVGDAVYGDLSASGYGGFAEYAVAPESAFTPKPDVSFEEAAAVPGAGVAALQGLRDSGRIRAGQHVLINGASGDVGTFAVQIARAFDTRVTGVCSTRNLDLVRSLGADSVVDYTREDVTAGDARYDLILDAAAFRPASAYRRILSPGGAYVFVGGDTRHMFGVLLKGAWLSRSSGARFQFLAAKPNRADLLALKDLVESGKVAPVIDRTYPLRDLPDALRRVEEGHGAGKVVLRL